MSVKEQRENFWNYLVTEKGAKPRGVTLKRLQAVKDSILADDNFWFQVIERFGAEKEMFGDLFYRRHSTAQSDQSRSNFWAMVRERL